MYPNIIKMFDKKRPVFAILVSIVGCFCQVCESMWLGVRNDRLLISSDYHRASLSVSDLRGGVAKVNSVAVCWTHAGTEQPATSRQHSNSSSSSSIHTRLWFGYVGAQWMSRSSETVPHANELSRLANSMDLGPWTTTWVNRVSLGRIGWPE